jgi:hypothetical protein
MKAGAPTTDEVVLPGVGAPAFTELLPPVPRAPDPLADTLVDARQRDLEAIDDALYEQAADILSGVQRAPDLDVANMGTEPPVAWVEQFGEQRALRMFRAAQQGWATKSDAPMFIHTALAVHQSVLKARSKEKGPAMQMQVAFITQHNYNYEEQEVEGE